MANRGRKLVKSQNKWESLPLKVLEAHCECSICLARFKDVATLNCGHSHCGRCLEPLLFLPPLTMLQLQANIFKPSITCPICRDVHHFEENETIQSLPQDATDVSKLAVLEKARPKAKEVVLEVCQICRFTDHKNAVYKCLSCDASLCQECLDKHNSEEERNNHFIALLEEGQSGKSILLCRKHSLCLKYFCNANGCEQLICTDCVLGEHRQHKISTLGEAKKPRFEKIYRMINLTVNYCNQSEQRMHETLTTCTKEFTAPEEALRSNARKQKNKILRKVRVSLDSAEQDVVSSNDNKLWEFQSSLHAKIDRIKRKQQQAVSTGNSLCSIAKEDNLSFLAKAEHLKTNITKAGSEGVEIINGLYAGLKLNQLMKEITDDPLPGLILHAIDSLLDLFKETSKDIPLQLRTEIQKVVESICKKVSNENDTTKLIHGGRDPTESNSDTEDGNSNEASSTISVAPGSSRQITESDNGSGTCSGNGAKSMRTTDGDGGGLKQRDSKRPLQEIDAREVNNSHNCKRSRSEGKVDDASRNMAGDNEEAEEEQSEESSAEE